MSKDKKVIYVGAFRFPNGDAAAPRVLNNAKIFRALGYSVDFLSWGGAPREIDKEVDGFYYYQGFKYYNTYDIDIKGLSPFNRVYNFFCAGRNSLRLLAGLITEADIIVAYNPSSYFTKKLMQLCKQNGTRYISDITEWVSSDELPGGRFAPPYWVSEYNMRISQKRVQDKIVISRYLDRYYAGSNNVVLPPLVDSNEEKWGGDITILPPFNGIRVIYAGTPGRKDLLETMLNAVVASLKGGLKIQFIVVGVSIEEIASYKDFTKIKQWGDNILFVGKVPQSEVPLYYKSSDFSIIVRENTRKNRAGFPTKFVESMMSGCPVIGNMTSDLSKYIQDGVNGIILPNFSINALVDALTKAAKLSVYEINQMKNRASISGREYFDFNHYLGKVSEFLRSQKYYENWD